MSEKISLDSSGLNCFILYTFADGKKLKSH